MKRLISLLFLALPLHAQTLGGFASFTDQGNSETWRFYDYATGAFTDAAWRVTDGDNGEIFATFNGDEGVSLFADDFTSDSNFIGDYTAAGIDTVTCDIFIEDVSTFSDAEFYFDSGGTFYYSEFYFFATSGWASMTASFSRDQWYIFDETENNFLEVELTPAILGAITEIGLNLYPSSAAADGQAVALDNFSLLPDLLVPETSLTLSSNLAEFSFTGIAGMEYTIQTSPSLAANSWINVGSPFEITGPSQTNLPIASKSFFRLQALPFFIDIP